MRTWARPSNTGRASGAIRPNRTCGRVRLMQAELHDELQAAGFNVAAGQMGENFTTRGGDQLALPSGTRLRLGDTAVVEITGLRNPCVQIDRFQSGLTSAVLGRDGLRNLV